jgi:O-antigen/teichoic acid export membrane protein
MTPPDAELNPRPRTADPSAAPRNPQSAIRNPQSPGPLYAAELDAAETAVTAAAVGSAVWTVLGFGAMQALRFGFNLILTRLVAPQVFGVMAIVNLCVQALHMFSDLGIRQCVVHHPRGDDADFLNTAWTLQVVRGLVLWGLAAAIARPAAAFYSDMPELAWLIPLVGFTAVADGFLSTALFTLSRRLARGRLVLLEVSTYTVWMTLVVLAMAVLGRETEPARLRDRQLLVFAAGGVLSSLSEMAVSYLLLRGHRHRLRWDPAAARDLARFGGWIVLNTATAFLAGQADRLVIGKISTEVLGVYHMAAQLARMPTLLLVALGGQIAFPLYSRLLRPDRPDRATVSAVHLLLAGGAAVLATGLFAAGPTLVVCIYPARYHAAADYIPPLAVWAWFVMLQSTAEAALLAIGRLRRIVAAHAVKLLALPPLLFAGYQAGGVTGLVVGYAAAEALRYLLLIEAVRRAGLPFWRDDLLLTLLAAAVCGLAVGAAALVGGEGSQWARLGVEVAVVVGFWAAVAGVLWLRGRIDVRSLRRRGVDALQ